MKSAAAAVRRGLGSAPTATYVVRFEQRPKRAPEREESAPAGSVPRVARLLALAHRIDGMIREGEIRDWAEAARLVGVTRARMTQIANLLLIAPMIQEAILDLPVVYWKPETVAERNLRHVMKNPNWRYQEQVWNQPRLETFQCASGLGHLENRGI